MATIPLPRISVEDYFVLDETSTDDRYEYIDGIPYLMAGGSNRHAAISGNVITALNIRLSDQVCMVYSSDVRVRLADQRIVHPDISISCAEQDRINNKAIQFPVLVIEILSPSTAGYDHGTKAAMYRACPSIQEYLFIDSTRLAAELFRREEAFWRFEAFGIEDTIFLASINTTIPVAELYLKIQMPPLAGSMESDEVD